MEKNPASAAESFRTLATAACRGLARLDGDAVTPADHAAAALAVTAPAMRRRLAAVMRDPAAGPAPTTRTPSPALAAALALLPLLSREEASEVAAALAAAAAVAK